MDNLIPSQALTIDSREVAQMVGREHPHLLRDIKTYIEYLKSSTNPKLDSLDFFQGSAYKDLKGEARLCYKITKKGCELIAHKMTGEKGTLFSATYINKFHEMEEKLKPQQPTCIEDVLIQSLQEMKDMRMQIAAANTIAQEAKAEIQSVREAITINPKAEWRKYTNTVLSKIGQATGDYKKPKDEAYNALKEKGRCRPNILVENLKERAVKQGMKKSKVDDLNILDVLENEPRLREIYVNIVKQMAAKYKITTHLPEAV